MTTQEHDAAKCELSMIQPLLPCCTLKIRCSLDWPKVFSFVMNDQLVTLTMCLYVSNLHRNLVTIYFPTADDNWTWDLNKSVSVQFNCEIFGSISTIVNVPSRLWCSARNQIHVVNHHSLVHDVGEV